MGLTTGKEWCFAADLPITARLSRAEARHETGGHLSSRDKTGRGLSSTLAPPAALSSPGRHWMGARCPVKA